MRAAVHPKGERGAAMILVLGLVSIMSAAAVFSFDSLSRLVQRNIVEQNAAQARHYALAAEQLGIAELRKTITDDLNFGQITARRLNTYDYNLEAATIRVHAEDISNCFNVNALVSGTALKGHDANADNMNQFAMFLQQYGLGAEAAFAISAAIADWQDSDTAPLPRGAEARFYANSDAAHRTPDAPMRSLGELRLIRDMSPSLLEQLAGVICINQHSRENRINVTTLAPRHAGLVEALLQGRVSRSVLEMQLEKNGLGYFATAGDFFNRTASDGRVIPANLREKFVAYPSLIRLTIDSTYLDAKLRLVTDVHFNSNGTYAIVSRKFGA